MNRLTLRLLGGFQLHTEAGDALCLSGRKEQALLAYLAHDPGRRHRRDALAELLWADRPEGRGGASVRQALSSLRRTLGRDGTALAVDGQLVWLDPGRIEVDSAEFCAGLGSPGRAALELAVSLYRGPLLSGLVARAPAFDDWVELERRRLQEFAVQALNRLMGLQEREGRLDEAVLTGQRLLALEASHEEIHRSLIRLYERLGRRSAALRQYERCAAALHSELGIAPAPPTRVLLQSLHQAPPSPSVASGLLRPRWLEVAATRPFVGREAELAVLARRVDAARRGAGNVQVIEGDAGIGKTALLARFVAAQAQSGLAVLAGRCQRQERGIAFAPWLDALRAAGPTHAVAALAESLLALRPEPKRGLSTAGIGSFDQARAFERIVDVLAGIATERPLLVILEDLQWADPSSVQLLAYLGPRLLPGRLACVLTINAEADAAESATLLALADLSRQGLVECLVLDCLGRDESGRIGRPPLEHAGFAPIDETVQQLWELSLGHPRTLVAGVQALLADGVPSDPTASMRGPIGARFGEPGGALRDIANMAAVAGPGAPIDLIVAASSLPGARAHSAVAALQRRGLLRVAEGKTTFAHRGHHAAVLEGLSPRLRRSLHRRLAEACSEPGSNLDAARRLMIGLHEYAGGRWAAAADSLHAAAGDAIARSSYAEAAQLVETALEANRRRRRDRVAITQEIDLRLDRGHIGVPLGEVRRGRSELATAARLADTINDRTRLARVFVAQINQSWLHGHYEDAEAAAQRAAALASAVADQRLGVAASFYRGQINLFCGDYHEAAACFRSTTRSSALLDDDACGLPGLPAVISRSWLVWSLAELGEFTAAAPLAEQSLRMAEASEHAFTRVDALRAVGIFHLRRGALEEGAEVLERGLALARATRLELWYPSLAAGLGYACALRGDGTNAVRHCADAVEQSERAGIVAGHSVRLAWLARGLLACGDTAQARKVAMHALQGARAQLERGSEAWLRQLLAEIAAADEDESPEVATEHVRRAMGLAQALHMRPLQAQCHLLAGSLHRRTGRCERSRRHWLRAAAMFGAMNARPWQARVEDLLRQ